MMLSETEGERANNQSIVMASFSFSSSFVKKKRHRAAHRRPRRRERTTIVCREARRGSSGREVRKRKRETMLLLAASSRRKEGRSENECEKKIAEVLDLHKNQKRSRKKRFCLSLHLSARATIMPLASSSAAAAARQASVASTSGRSLSVAAVASSLSGRRSERLTNRLATSTRALCRHHHHHHHHPCLTSSSPLLPSPPAPARGPSPPRAVKKTFTSFDDMIKEVREKRGRGEKERREEKSKIDWPGRTNNEEKFFDPKNLLH